MPEFWDVVELLEDYQHHPNNSMYKGVEFEWVRADVKEIIRELGIVVNPGSYDAFIDIVTHRVAVTEVPEGGLSIYVEDVATTVQMILTHRYFQKGESNA